MHEAATDWSNVEGEAALHIGRSHERRTVMSTSWTHDLNRDGPTPAAKRARLAGIGLAIISLLAGCCASTPRNPDLVVYTKSPLLHVRHVQVFPIKEEGTPGVTRWKRTKLEVHTVLSQPQPDERCPGSEANPAAGARLCMEQVWRESCGYRALHVELSGLDRRRRAVRPLSVDELDELSELQKRSYALAPEVLAVELSDIQVRGIEFQCNCEFGCEPDRVSTSVVVRSAVIMPGDRAQLEALQKKLETVSGAAKPDGTPIEQRTDRPWLR